MGGTVGGPDSSTTSFSKRQHPEEEGGGGWVGGCGGVVETVWDIPADKSLHEIFFLFHLQCQHVFLLTCQSYLIHALGVKIVHT